MFYMYVLAQIVFKVSHTEMGKLYLFLGMTLEIYFEISSSNLVMSIFLGLTLRSSRHVSLLEMCLTGIIHKSRQLRVIWSH